MVVASAAIVARSRRFGVAAGVRPEGRDARRALVHLHRGRGQRASSRRRRTTRARARSSPPGPRRARSSSAPWTATSARRRWSRSTLARLRSEVKIDTRTSSTCSSRHGRPTATRWRSSRSAAASTPWTRRDGASKRLTTGPSDEAPDWSPAGDWIAFHRQIRGSNYDLFAVNAATGKERRLTHDCEAADEPRVVAGRQADRIRRAAGQRAVGDRHDELRRHAGASGSPTPTISAQEPSWSPDGKSIAFILQELDKADGGRDRRRRTARPRSASPTTRSSPRSRAGRRTGRASPSPRQWFRSRPPTN